MNRIELIPRFISSLYLIVNAVLSLYKYEIIEVQQFIQSVCSTFKTRLMSCLIQLRDYSVNAL